MNFITKSALAVLLAITCFACSTDSKEKNPLIGHWELTKVNASPEKGFNPAYMDFVINMQQLDRMEFTKDNHYRFVGKNGQVVINAAYALSEDNKELTLNMDKEAEKDTYKITFSKTGEAVLTDADGMTLHIQKRSTGSN
jgi:hypothetical protein